MNTKQQQNAPNIAGFSFVRPLGSGGFAQVYLYEQDMPRRTVAIKVLENLKNQGGEAAELRRVFESEADVMASLSTHPAIVSIYQASISLDGFPYIAMEYCPQSLGALTKRNPAPLAQVLDTGVRLAAALETAHRSQVLHRDIKPSNVLLTSLGRPVLSDFGISQASGTRLGEAQELAMSIPWSAPEVLDLSTPGTVASEIWALGATLYSFAAGRSPFELPEREQNTRKKITERIKRAKYRPIPGAQGYQHLDAVLSAALTRDPAKRYRNMQQFGEALQELQRTYGFDVTQLEISSTSWAPGATLGTAVRGPVVTSLERETRADRRAANAANPVHYGRSAQFGRTGRGGLTGRNARTGKGRRGANSAGATYDKDGLLIEPYGRSALRAGLYGALITLGVIAVIAGVAWAIWGRT